MRPRKWIVLLPVGIALVSCPAHLDNEVPGTWPDCNRSWLTDLKASAHGPIGAPSMVCVGFRLAMASRRRQFQPRLYSLNKLRTHLTFVGSALLSSAGPSETTSVTPP